MSEGDKQHAPTERRLAQAAEKGDVKRSADLPRAASVVLAVTIGMSAAAEIGVHVQNLLGAWLSEAGNGNSEIAMGWTNSMVAELTPLMFLLIGLAVGTSLLSGGWILSLQQLMPDLKKISPSHGLSQIFSKHGVTETLKSMLKFIIIGGIGADMIYKHAGDFEALAAASAPSGGLLVSLCLQILVAISVAVVALAAVDVALQHWLHRQKLRMTDQDMRNEMKDSVGNPHVKQRQRAMARRMARTRQMKRIPEASVVVTNPTHFAVAIRYRRGTDVAPVLLAKGVGLLAAEIVSRARGYGIPVVEAPPLARAVYQHVEPGDNVPVALYRGCAEVLAYVWKMQHWRASGGERPKPPTASSLKITPEMESREKKDAVQL
jgi:flagellar biosynthetic protein FlhB